jgi:hypothetical protein
MRGVFVMSQVSLQEKERALNNAVASVEMEGYRVSDDEKKLCMDVLNGKLTKDDFIKIMLERCTA